MCDEFWQQHRHLIFNVSKRMNGNKTRLQLQICRSTSKASVEEMRTSQQRKTIQLLANRIYPINHCCIE